MKPDPMKKVKMKQPLAENPEQSIESSVYNKRIASLDALRGFTMFWIIGGDTFFRSLADAVDWPIFRWFTNQFSHAEWNGFHFYDLIFPLFMFVSGVAIPYSLGRKLEKGIAKKDLIKKAAKRALILVALGIIYNNKFSFDFANMRYASVLGQIGVAYFFAALIFLYNDSKKQLLWVIIILLGFWAAMTLIPVPGFGAGVLTPEGNFSGHIDRILLPGRLYRPFYDPQGILLMFSATAVTLMGALTGSLLKNEKHTRKRKSVMIMIAGILLVLSSLVWNIWYPINKEIWSSSYNLLTAGISMILFSFFYFVIDVKSISKWSFPLVVVGMNPITIYMAEKMINFQFTSEFFLSGVMHLAGEFEPVVSTVGVIMLEYLFLYFLYRRKIFLKV